MSDEIFAFSLRTKSNLNAGSVFGANGEVVGQILSKRPKFKDEWNEISYDDFYTYDVESLKETYEKIKNGEIILNADDYSIDDCSTSWVRGNN